eukprot:Blabericola_migrator_1__1693@NODE_1456_length_4515_cov_129_363534_g962_i0_p4_GENE_NODE_1456_length_4515_cov_129_363534_g962_i0NODE_1456_length_4515_cov_129_363534_g962_i0_p4_ORF_typecomplete_len189_score13_79_NODE_1456_length_4515_cov_129_363534_g962_i029513517
MLAEAMTETAKVWSRCTLVSPNCLYFPDTLANSHMASPDSPMVTKARRGFLFALRQAMRALSTPTVSLPFYPSRDVIREATSEGAVHTAPPSRCRPVSPGSSQPVGDSVNWKTHIDYSQPKPYMYSGMHLLEPVAQRRPLYRPSSVAHPNTFSIPDQVAYNGMTHMMRHPRNSEPDYRTAPWSGPHFS